VEETPGQVTLLLNELKLGRRDALSRLIPLVYQELRSMADHYLQAERKDHTLGRTALVNELYLRLVNQDRADWKDRAHFLGVAAHLMRRILVDHARSRQRAKRSGVPVPIDIEMVKALGGELRTEEILAVDEALDRLAAVDGQQARIVELRYFTELTVEETAEVLGISPRTVKRDWAMAAAWLRNQLAPAADP
jgi:RNA polymerase sigma factor (TIGR02999 family)